MITAIYPGSFDPVTNGHLDIIKRTAKVFPKVIVTVFTNNSKVPMFSVEERMALLEKVTIGINNVEIDSGTGLLVEYAASKKAHIIIKGLRAVSDFEYEFQMALMNNKLNRDIETLFMTTSSKYSYLSSSIVKEVARYQGCLKELVPVEIINDIKNKAKNYRR